MADLTKLIASIQKNEGFRKFPYQDTTGHITIGYGRNLSNVGVSPYEASVMLSNDIAVCEKDCEAQVWWPTIADDDVRSRAILEIAFNCGIGGLLTFHQALACLAAGDFTGAASAFMQSEWANQVGQRAVNLTEMIRTGFDPVAS